jgi:alanine racemase
MSHTWTELDLGILSRNIDKVKATLTGRTKIIFVVKADAYGHGLRHVARCAAECGIEWFAVAHLEEALEVRKAASRANIVILSAIDPNQAVVAIEKNLTPIIVSEQHALALASQARAANRELRCHAKIDTGMGRLGFQWEDAAASLKRINKAGGLAIEGMCMHLASAAGTPDKFAETQWNRFQEVVEGCKEAGMEMPFKHASNTAAFFAHPEWDLDGVRIGFVIYGYSQKNTGIRVQTKPCLQWKSRIVQVKKVPAGFRVGYYSTFITTAETYLATIEVGYADGYSRLLSNKGFVLIEGRRVPVIGRVTMNFIMADLGPETRAREGDEVVLMGAQGNEAIWSDEIAKACKTIPYEVFTSIRTDDRRVVDG